MPAAFPRRAILVMTIPDMSGRIGICDKCSQRYGDIPESVTALKVKCQVCDGTVNIPPLPVSEPVAAAPVEPAPAEAAPEAPAAADKPLAAPLGSTRPKPERPEKAKSIDRDVAAPAPPEAKPEVAKPAAPKVAKPVVPVKPIAKVGKPVVPVRPVAKGVKPVVPVKPIAKVTKPVTPVKPTAKVAKPAAPVAKPVQKPAPVKPVAKAPAPKPVAKAPAPVAKATPPAAAKPVEKKPSPADIIAKAKAKRAQESTSTEAPVAKASPADIIAKAKAKRAAEPATGGKDSAADIIARAKQKRGGSEKAAPAAKRVSSDAPTTERDSRLPKASGTRRPGGRKGGTSKRRQREEEEVVEKSKAPMIIIGVVVLGAIGGGGWWAMRPDAEVVDETTITVDAPAATTPEVAPGATGSSTGEDEEIPQFVAAAAEPPPEVGADAPEGSAEPATDEEAKPAPVVVPASGKDWVVPAIGEPVNTRGVIDYKIIHLDQVPPLERWSGNNDEEWAEIQEDLVLFLDDSGAQSNRAGKRLVDDYPRGAFPAIVNAMMKIDFEDKDDMFIASTLNELLSQIGQGTNFGWGSVSGEEPGSEKWVISALQNKKVVGAWHKMWVDRLSIDDTAWANFASSAADKAAAKKKAAEPAADASGVVGPEEDMFD